MSEKCVFDGSMGLLRNQVMDLLWGTMMYNKPDCENINFVCETIAAKFVHENFKEKKSYVPKCSACGATCWSNNRTRGSKRICKKCFEKN